MVMMLMNSIEEMIKQIYIDLCDASISRDLEKLNEILAEDYVLIHMTGKKQSKKEYMNSVQNGELKYYESIHEEILVTVEENTAKVIGKTRTLASPFGAGKSWWNLRQDLVMEKINDKWLIKQSKASMY